MLSDIFLIANSSRSNSSKIKNIISFDYDIQTSLFVFFNDLEGFINNFSFFKNTNNIVFLSEVTLFKDINDENISIKINNIKKYNAYFKHITVFVNTIKMNRFLQLKYNINYNLLYVNQIIQLYKNSCEFKHGITTGCKTYILFKTLFENKKIHLVNFIGNENDKYASNNPDWKYEYDFYKNDNVDMIYGKFK